MHISKLTLINYRNFLNAKLIFEKGINTLIGENGSGKTNIFRAIRLLLDNSLPRAATKLSENDFCRQLGDWKGHWIIISLEFDEIAEDEVSQALFIHGVGNIGVPAVNKATYNLIFRPKAHMRKALGELPHGNKAALDTLLSQITLSDYETIFTGKSASDFNDPEVYKAIVGDFENVIFPTQLNLEQVGVPLPNILSMSGEVSFTFVKALRDVVSDFRNNRTNPLYKLLKLKSSEINEAEFDPIVQLVCDLNDSIEQLSDVQNIKTDIKETINNALGDTYSPSSIAIKSDLSNEAEQLFQSLALFVDESDDGYEGGVHEMSLGGANLIFLTLKLLEFKYQNPNESIANFLLIEEPEAHIHTHIQKSLFSKIDYDNTQIIYSTHSSHISEVSKIKNTNIISKTASGCVAFQPSTDLSSAQIIFVERYLDAIRSNLLFAKSVILVEGDAEEILIPALVEKVFGISLDELGITLVNMRSTGFENVALLFNDKRIQKKCSVITDLDSLFFDTTINSDDTPAVRKRKTKAQGSNDKGAARKVALDILCDSNAWLSPFYAKHTFEVDFLDSGNRNYLVSILDSVYVDQATKDRAKQELASNIAESGLRALTMANHQGKGWFAITLSNTIDFNVRMPEYIVDAVVFAHDGFSAQIKFEIINYRYKELKSFIRTKRGWMSGLVLPLNKPAYDDWNRYLLPLESGMAIFEPKFLQFSESGGDIEELKSAMINDIKLPSSNSILEKI
jgi:putative ATP-dependent endonuclease of OLD family